MTAKPRIVVVSKAYARVSYRGLTGSLRANSPRSWEAIAWMGLEVGAFGDVVAHYAWSGEQALKALVRALDVIADCHELAILVDRLEGAGLRTRIEQIGGERAVQAFDRALGFVQRVAAFEERISLVGSTNQALNSMTLINGMIKVASAKRSPKPVKVSASWFSDSESYALTIIPGFSVTFDADGRTYHVGETCEVGSYNLHYYGAIQSITARTVTASQEGKSKAKRLRIGEFAARNHDGLEAKFARDADTMQYI